MINFGKMRLRIKRWRKSFKPRQSTINAVAVVVVAALAVYTAVQISRNISTSVSTLRTQQITDVESLSLKGYIFRDEKLYYVRDNNVADFLVENGEKVGAGKHIADIYTAAAGADISKVQSELSSVSDRIRLLENGITEAKKLSQSTEIFNDINSAYYAFLSAVQDGNFSLADKQEKLFLDAVNSYMSATGRTEEAKSVLSALKSQKESFISQNLSGGAQELCVEQSCYFYTGYDGYEEIFDYSRVGEVTPAELSSLTSSEKKEYNGVIGKQVFSPVWYICFPVSDELCDMFVNNSMSEYPTVRYEASFLSNNGVKVTLSFERAAYSDADGNSGFVMFSCKQMPTGFEFLRAQNVQIELGETTGYRVPEEATFSELQKNYVYVLSGNMVEKRRITVIGRADGYYIVNTYERDYEESGEEDVPYLAVNELIITSGRGLYDGKLLK